jgi:hypothetical protein
MWAAKRSMVVYFGQKMFPTHRTLKTMIIPMADGIMFKIYIVTTIHVVEIS